MKKIRVFILIMVMFVISGCSSEVTLTINDNIVNEKVVIDVSEDKNKKEIKLAFRNYIPIYKDDVLSDTEPDEPKTGVIYYNREDTGNQLVYTTNFPLTKYINSYALNSAFYSPYIKVDSSSGEVIISTNKNGMLVLKDYPNLSSVKVNIIVPYKVLDNNADSVKGNVYTWNFTRNSNKAIYIKYNPKENSANTIQGEEQTVNLSKDKKTPLQKLVEENIVLFVILGFGGFAIILFVVLKITK